MASGSGEINVEDVTIDSFEHDEISNTIDQAFSRFSSEKPFDVEECQALALSALPDTVMLKIFSNLSQPELCRIALVCKHWLWVVYDSELWKFVDLSRFNKIQEQDILNLIQVRLSPLLKTLNLSNCPITPIIIHELTDHCQQLNNLVMKNCDLEISEENRVSLLSVPDNLIRLDVRNSTAGYQFMHVILEAQDMSQLECFGFGNGQFCPSFTDFQVMFSKMHSLRILDCIDCDSVNDARVLVFADELKVLESLALKKCKNVTGSSLSYLIAHASNLKSLNLSGTDITDFSILNAQWEMSKIEELDFSFCEQLTSDGLSASIPRITTLQYLALNNTGRGKAVSGELLESASVFESWNALTVLSLHFCIRLYGEALPLLKYCSKLERLSLRTCTHINFNDISLNLKLFPNLVALECGSLFSSDEGTDCPWIHLLDSIASNCKHMMYLVLVKCSQMPISKVSEYRAIISNFIQVCCKLDTIAILYSEKPIYRLIETCIDMSIRSDYVKVITSPSVNIIPPFRYSLDSEINRDKFKKFFRF